MTKSQNNLVVSAVALTVVEVVVAACLVVGVVRQWAAVTEVDQITVVDPRPVPFTELLVSCVILNELAMAMEVAVVAAVVVAIRRSFNKNTLSKTGPLSFGNFVTVKLSQYCNMLSTVKVLVESLLNLFNFRCCHFRYSKRPSTTRCWSS